MQQHTTRCADGGEVGLTLHSKDSNQGPVVLIHPATAVRESMYWPFAAFLITKGFRVITYNYRGVGPSARLPSNQNLTMHGWMTQDVPAVTAWAEQSLPDASLLAIGHSLGGHAIGLGGNSKPLTAAALIASHAGALRLVRGRAERLRIATVFRAIVPTLSRLSGHFPARMLGIGEDIPSAAMREWGRWIVMKDYFFSDPLLDAARQFAEVDIPLLSIGFDDDPWATAPAIDLFNAHFTKATVDRRQIDPAANGNGPIGHMGFFRDRNRETLWPQVADWLIRQANFPTVNIDQEISGPTRILGGQG
ncbi:alpha/beta fold hydrolase [Paracoccus sp. 11-3]|uniref:Alpha/beta fold hydrolase n=1 Tax=Paracoccus amoyensis TaxID=2760093 RepID=A0A926JDY3_9RHOB|nr:alpha/beta fold hydrolase [Paracoccus amoyensis]MBC9247553.1 alpha/beta fold hydrolase [Paracoccus amoyensis]